MQEPSSISTCYLKPQDLCFGIQPSDIAPPEPEGKSFAVIGQDRAMMALRLALSIREKGYNVFVSGPAGTGKRTAVYHVISTLPADLDRLRDVALCHNFRQDDAPGVLFFSRGTARDFRERLKRFIASLGDSLRELVRQDHFKHLRDRMLLESEHAEQQLIFDFEGRLNERGFQMVQIDEEDEKKTDILPLVKGEVSDFDELQDLVAKGEFQQSAYESLREQYFGLVDELQDLFRTLQAKRQETQDKIRDMRIQIVSPYIKENIEKLRADFESKEVHEFLDELSEELVSHTGVISRLSSPNHGGMPDPDGDDDGAEANSQLARYLSRYDINILIDHGQTKTNPVIFEQYPDAAKLFGSVEPLAEGAEPQAAHMQVRAGSLLKASGGYLVLKAEDLVREEEVYVGLKRALSEGALEIRAVSGPMGPQGPLVKPLPIKLDLKVIVMAPDGLYELLYDKDEDFQKLFKVPADFDYMVERTPAICRAYVDFFNMIVRESKLLPVDDSAVCALLEFAARDAEFRNKLSTRFSVLADVLREAGHWAKEQGASLITRAIIDKTLDTRRFLYSLPEEKLDEMIAGGEILMELSGSAVGRVNGLAVMDRGFYSFGRPTVISAQVSPGSEGVINVEHEAGLSGEIHDKGAFIVGSFIQATYARDFPLSIKASICFEQSYTEVDGDSASSAEVYTLLSAISGLALRQDLAVTGSVNQRGQIQPVGGINEKIEGFYEICRKTGLTGTQGVIIPVQNVQNLVLNPGVQEAVRQGKFFIYAIKTVYEGLEILTGIEAGTRNAKGHFPNHSINALVEKRLQEMAITVKDFG